MRKTLLKILTLLLLCAALTPCLFAQTAKNSQAANKNAEMMSENESLPFMREQEAAAPDESGSGGLLIKTLGAMLLIVGLLFAGAWAARKLGFGDLKTDDAPDDLKIISSVSLGGGRTISTVRFGRRTMIVGSTPQSFTLLGEERTGDESFRTPRSVAEMLADENCSFEEEFARAQAGFSSWETEGEID